MLHFILLLASLGGCQAQPGVEKEDKGEQTNDVPIKFMRDAQDYAYHASGEGTEARAASHEARAKIAARRAAEANADVKVSHGINSGYLAPVEAQTKGTDASAAVSIDWNKKTRSVIDQTDALAYAAAKSAAEGKVAELKAGAAAYFQELLAALKAKAAGPSDPKFAAASAAAKPYLALQLQTMGVVDTYFIFCSQLMAKAKGLVKAAFGIATEANFAQAQGKADLALRKMVQAHGLIGAANLDEGLAKNVYKLAQSIQVSAPAFAQAASIAADHAYANALLQNFEDSVENGGNDGSQPPKRNPFVAKTKKKPATLAERADADLLNDAIANSPVPLDQVQPPSEAQLLQLKKHGDEIGNAIKSFEIESDKLADDLDKFTVKAEAETKQSLGEAEKVAEFLSHKFGNTGKGKIVAHAAKPVSRHIKLHR